MPPPAAALGGYRRNANDRSAPLLLHRRQDRLRHVHRAAQTDIQDTIVISTGYLKRLRGLGNAGIVD